MFKLHVLLKQLIDLVLNQLVFVEPVDLVQSVLVHLLLLRLINLQFDS